MLLKLDVDYYDHDCNHDYDKCDDAVHWPCVGLCNPPCWPRFFWPRWIPSLQVTPAHFEVTMMIILSINNINHFKVTIITLPDCHHFKVTMMIILSINHFKVTTITLPDCHHFNRQRYEDNHYLSISTHKFVVENYILFACLGVNFTNDVNHYHQH